MLSHRTKLILAFFTIYVIWGSTFLGVQIGLKSFPPFLFSALRLLMAGGALALFCLVRGEPLPSVAEIGKHVVCGLVIFIGGIVAVVWAQQYISSSLASTIITTPFWFVVLDRAQWKFYFSSKWVLGGLFLGLLGVVLLMSFKEGGRVGSESEALQFLGVLTMIIGSFFWVAGSLYLKYKPSQCSVYVSTSIQMLCAGLFCVIVSGLNSEWQPGLLYSIQAESIVALFYLGLVSSLLGFLSFIWLIKVEPPAIVSTYSYVNPLIATLLGWAFANEDITALQVGCLAMILLGVLFVNIPRYQFGNK